LILKEAKRLMRLPPYLFGILDPLKKEVRESGVEVIDLLMGSPDLLPPRKVLDTLKECLDQPDMHRYSWWDGDIERDLRKSIADYYETRFGVSLDPEKEILPLVGSKEGVAHLAFALLNNDDISLVPSPSYPVHFNGAIMAGGILYNIPMRPENQYKPNLHSLSAEIFRLSKTLFLSYPHNPTTAVASLEYFTEVVDFLEDKDIVLCHDLAYSDIVFDGLRAPSVLEVKNAKQFTIEFHTFSKSYSLAGWRIGFAVGNKDIISALKKTKSYIDFGVFRAFQKAATTALRECDDYVKAAVKEYEKRRDVFCRGLKEAGWPVSKPQATFYVWVPLPRKYSALPSIEFCKLLLKETGVASAPGTGFGEHGEGFVRFALVNPLEKIKEATKRIKNFLEL